MPGRPNPLPAALAFAVFTTDEARRAGVTRVRLRASDLRSMGRGLWARTDRTLTEREIVSAYCRRDPAVFAVGLTAARLWKFPLPGAFGDEVIAAQGHTHRVNDRAVHRPRGDSVDNRVHLGTRSARRRESALVRWSALDLEPVSLDGSPPVLLTTRSRTLLDLSALLMPDDLVVIGDHLVRRPRPGLEGRAEPYATVEELIDESNRFTGRGAPKAEAAITQVRVSSDSPAETRLRLAFLRAGLPEPLLNVRASENGESGTSSIDLGEPDLHWPQWRVAVEHEGPSHLDAEQLPKDIARGERRQRAGWIEVRTTAKDLRYGCRSAIDRTRDALLRQGWSPS
ncbi:hypothetical protein [Brachybacterium sp. FME24]|uniref:hypothetical protein n=1 Tax=Brachybacterium sp. FME24 TaxID=2742605 RepID=UPI0018675522|nr:hypothetical protein [Brachybacterium sp. FME24]